MTKTVTVLSGLIRPLVENRLPEWVEPRLPFEDGRSKLEFKIPYTPIDG